MTALNGIKVLDLTRLLPGPYCTMLLADFGAEVIKIEQPGEGDYARWYQPQRAGMGYRHIVLNRNKKSMTIDLKSDRGKEIFYKLAKQADVILESFRPGVMKRLGIDYDSVKAINPSVIYCSMTGFGQEGPYSLEAGHDINYISLAGITSLTGEKGGKPYIPGIQIADISGGLMAAVGILIALNSRSKTGIGQYVDISLFSAALAMLPSDVSIYFGSGLVPLRGESRLTGALPNYNIYKTKDNRYLAVGALEKKFWINLCIAIGKEDIIDEIDKKEKHNNLFVILESVFQEKTLAQWEGLLKGKDTCVTAVKNLDEVFDDMHVKQNDLVVELNDEVLGVYKQIGIPIKLLGTPGKLNTKAPELGEHTQQILKDIGYSGEEIMELKFDNII